ncbi:Predicted outer membrane protein [Micromonospora nigra]|uniref:Predicted outer membrane protein n=1 Tax=Micromonospora nigra TaxID=145857 RepID=A0A1C6RH33_9ACTN|nr:DUF4142 domain-containing protein [Micromonospora nigra]SCL16367.1 Predicted outer membrane protein [Micromonospora nigra]
MLGIKRLGLLAVLVLVGLAPAAAAQAAQPSEQDTQYVQAVHQANLYEIEAGELAQQKAQSQEVKELAQKLYIDHTQLDQSVRELAQQLGIELPTELMGEQKQGLEQLRNASGEEFDRLWVTQSLNGHVTAIQATQTEISQGSEPQVVQLAQTALPVLQAHYDALVQLAEHMGIPVPQASGTGTPTPGGTMTPAPGGTTTETPVPQQS